MRMKEKVAIVTGGASGIGEATAHRFAEEGAAVVIADIDEERGAEVASRCVGEGQRAEFVPADVAKPADIERVIETTLSDFGYISTLFNGAAWMSGFKIATETSEEEWDHALDVDLKAPFLFAKGCIPHMIAAGGGSIINVASVGGLVGFASYAAYCSAKGGLIQSCWHRPSRRRTKPPGRRSVRLNSTGIIR